MTNRRVFALFWILCLFLFQNTISTMFPAAHFPFLLVGVIFYAMTDGPEFGAVIGCFAGFLLDILGAGKLGSSMMVFSVVGLLTGLSSTKIFYDSLFTQIFLPVAAQYAFCLYNLLFAQDPMAHETQKFGILKDAFFISQPWFTLAASIAGFSFLKNVTTSRYSRSIIRGRL